MDPYRELVELLLRQAEEANKCGKHIWGAPFKQIASSREALLQRCEGCGIVRVIK